MASPGSVARTVGSCKATGGMRGVKRLEPHGREQGAIDLQGPVRSKPSESGGTTRAEGVLRLAAQHRRLNLSREMKTGTGRKLLMSVEGRSLENHKRGSSDGGVGTSLGLRTKRWCGTSEEPRGPDRVFEDAAKDRGMRAGSLLTGGTLNTGKPRRSGVQRQGQGGMQEKPKDLHL